MGLEDFLISTGVDGLINLIHKMGRIETSQAAAQLGMPISTVEDWAKTLETEGLIRIEYKLTKEFLVWASLSPQKYTQKKEQVEKNKEETLSKLSGLKKSVDQNLEELERAGQEFESKKQGVSVQLNSLSADVREAGELAAAASSVIAQKKGALKELSGELEMAREELAEFEKAMKDQPASQKGGRGDEGKELLQKLEKASTTLEEKVRVSSQEFENITNQINAIRDDLESDTSSQQLEQVKSELEDIRFARNELVKSAKALLQEASEMGKRQKSLDERVGAIESVRSNKADAPKIREEIDAAYKKATKASRDVMYEMQNNMQAVKKQIQDYSQAAYRYQSLQGHLQNIEGGYSKESAQLNELLHRLDEAQAKYDADLKNAQETLGDKKEKFEGLLNKVKQIDLMLSNIRELEIEGKKLSTRLKGLMMEANVIDMAAPEGVKSGAPVYMPAADVRRKLEGRGKPAAAGAGTAPISHELAQKITLSEEEEKEFEKKREELRWLIHRMWEEDRGGNAGA
ncbi:MAG: hypothetical protein V1822_01560 [Candidatus Micrarchaeota archaeon]